MIGLFFFFSSHYSKRRPQTTPLKTRNLPPIEAGWASGQLSRIAASDIVEYDEDNDDQVDSYTGEAKPRVNRLKIRKYDDVIDDGDTTMFERESPRSIKVLRSLLLTFMDDNSCALKKKIDLRR